MVSSSCPKYIGDCFQLLVIEKRFNNHYVIKLSIYSSFITLALNIFYCAIFVASFTIQLTPEKVERKGNKARKEDLLNLHQLVDLMEGHLTWVRFVYDLNLKPLLPING
ncbi:hypothetical protein ACOSP7_023188 [Xanthoceras sorbifolium]